MIGTLQDGCVRWRCCGGSHQGQKEQTATTTKTNNFNNYSTYGNSYEHKNKNYDLNNDESNMGGLKSEGGGGVLHSQTSFCVEKSSDQSKGRQHDLRTVHVSVDTGGDLVQAHLRGQSFVQAMRSNCGRQQGMEVQKKSCTCGSILHEDTRNHAIIMNKDDVVVVTHISSAGGAYSPDRR